MLRFLHWSLNVDQGELENRTKKIYSIIQVCFECLDRRCTESILNCVCMLWFNTSLFSGNTQNPRTLKLEELLRTFYRLVSLSAVM